MNERIKELLQQVGTDVSGKWISVDNAEKLAELIIREYSYDVMDLTAAPEHVAMAARHWGVEL